MAEQQIELAITGMTCASCVNRVEKALKKVPGVLDASVNLASEQASVTYLPTSAGWSELKAAVENAGYGVIETADTDAGSAEDVEAAARARELADKRRKLIVGIAFGLPLFLLSMARDFGLIAPWLTPFWAAAEAQMDAAGGNVGGTMIMHYPAAAYFYSIALLLFGIAGHTYFETAGLIITLILVGKYLEARAKSQTSAAIKTLIGLQAKTARVLRRVGTGDWGLGT